MKRTLQILLLVLSISQANSQAFWKGLNGIYGGTQSEIINHTATGALVTINNGGLFRSTDSGANWTRIANGILSTEVAIRGLTIDGAGKLYCHSSSRLYTSTDGGLNWIQTTTSAFSLSGPIKVSPVNGNIFVGNFNQVLRSTDGGQTFNPTTFSANNILDMEINSSGHVIVSVYGQSGIYITTNNGVSWSPMSSGTYTGFPTLNINYSYKIAVDNSNNLFAITDVGPFRLLNGATTWTSIKGTLTESSFYGNIFAAGSSVYLTNNNANKLFTYNGSVWNSGVAYPFSGLDISSFAPISATEFYMGVAGLGVFKTTNSGALWSHSSSGIKGFSYSDFYITPNGRLFVAWSNLGYLLSLDDGSTWDLTVSGNANRYLNGFVTLSDNTILGFGSGAIRSVDNGNNWTVQNASQILNQVVVNGTSLYSFSSNNLLTSVNQGVNWSSTAISGLPTTTQKILVDGSNNTYFLANNSLYKVNSGATTATLLSGVSSLRDFLIISNTIYALSANGTVLAKSIDGGTSWTTQLIPSTSYANKIWAYDTKTILTQSQTLGSCNLSTDGGATWTSKPLLDSFGTLTDAVFKLIGASDIFVYGAVNNSVIHKSASEIVLPSAPTNLTITTVGFNLAEFIWDDNATNEDFNYVEVSEGNNTSYELNGNMGIQQGSPQGKGYGWANGLKPNTTYFIRVYSANGAGNSAYSNEISITTLNQCPSTIPDNRSWTGVTVADPGYTPNGAGPFTKSNVTIKLTPNSNYYTVSAYNYNAIPPAIHGDPDITSNAATIVETCGQAYLYSANEDINNGVGTWDNTTKKLIIKWRTIPYYDDFRATTTLTLNSVDPIPTTPTLALYLYSSTELLLNWSQPGFETSYVIQRATVSGGPYTDINFNYPKTSYVDKSLTTGTTYFYRIKAVNASGSSAYSAEQSINLSAGQLFRPVENSINLNFENQQGVSWGDLDGDGDEDIASPSFTNNAGLSVPPVFYENKGGGAFDRRDLSVLANDNDAVSRGINILDFNNDGKLDMYITRSGVNKADLLLINNGGWDFTRIVISAVDKYSTGFKSAAAADYDNDGLVDVYVGNDIAGVATVPGFLLKSSNGTSFTTVTEGALATDLVNARLSSWADYDNDNDQDLFIVNFTSPTSASKLYKNNGDGTFTRVIGTIFDTDLIPSGRTISWGDIDNDGDLDLYVGLSTPSAAAAFNDRLYRNDGNNIFTNLTTSPVAESATPTFGSSFGDIDNDGDLDLLVVNTTANSIFFNNGSGTFTKSTAAELFTNPNTFEIGLALADFDKDGFLDAYPSKGNTTLTDLPNFLYKNNSTASSSKNWIEIKLEGSTSNRAAVGARIKVITTTPSRTQIREVSSRTGYGSQNSLIQHFGLGTATSISQIEVRWPSGAIQTLTNISSINRVMLIKEDLTPPAFTFNPPANSTNAIASNKLEIILSETATPVGGKNLVIRKGSSTATPLQTIAVNAGVIDGNKVTFTLAANLEYLSQYFVSIDAGSFIDEYQNVSLVVAATDWTFTTEEVPDVTPPTIVFDPPATLAKNFASGTKFELTAADNKGIATVTMFYRKVTEINFKQLPGTFNTSTSKYDFALSQSFFDDMGLEYYFEAKDAKPNTTRHPVTGNHLTRLSLTEDLLALSIAPGTAVSNYRIISIPFELVTTQVGLVFDELGAPDPKEWRLLKYVHNPQSWNEGFQNLARGEGYFIISKTAANIGFGTVSSPNYTQSNPFVINLKQGFNLIGNPYTMPINWNEVRSGITGVGELKIYQGGSYTNIGNVDLGVFEGGFVFATADVNVPVKFKTTTGGRTAGSAIGSDLEQEEWVVPIILSQGNQTFNLGGIGMAKNAAISYDDLDDFAPPSLLGKQEIKFSHPEHFMKYFARDVVPTQNEYEWGFDVNTEIEGVAELKWDNTFFGDNTNELYLLDVARQVVTDMRKTNQITFDPQKSTMFKIYFGKDLRSKIKPEGVFLGKPFPNPTNSNATIGFTLPESNSLYQVQLEIYNSVGQRKAVLVNENLRGGFYTSVWDTENNNNGFYFYRLSVSSGETRKVLTEKIIINR